MIRNDSRSGKRSAFTLVELLVVILIIAILVSLLSSAVLKAMQKIPEVQTRTEVAEMAVALQAFMSDYNLSEPPPSSLLLSEDILGGYTPGDPSLTFLKRVFGKNLGIGVPFVDWNGDGIRNGPWRLQGHQCLVFYLGGIVPNIPGPVPIPNLALGPQGFSTNNINPALLTGKRKGPYFNFVTSRLVPPPATAANPLTFSPGFPVYVDPWQSKSGGFYNALTTAGTQLGGTPYAYFSSNGINNGYNYTDCSGLAFLDGFLPTPRQQIALPYYTAVNALGAPIAYTYPNSYQIISAGKDGVFGYNLVPPSTVPPPPSPGFISNNNLWVPSSGALGSGADDQANFSGSLLGSGQS